MMSLDVVDFFAGAGGFSTGARMAGCRVRWAGNHWPLAVEIHQANHPETEHACQDLQQADWAAVPRHDVLLASPACQGHSPARGKDRPHHDATRSTAFAVVSAAEYHRPAAIVVENVPAFGKWVLYPAWCMAMNALGYAMQMYVLDTADHGVPQHRKRLFIVCTRSKHPVELRIARRDHVPATSFLDFSRGEWSRVSDKVAATRTRVCNGRKAFGERFVMPYYGSGSGLSGRSIHRPIGTITTRDRWGLVDGDRMRMLTKEENTAAMGFAEGYILPDSPKLALHLLGNAVSPIQACDVITALKECV